MLFVAILDIIIAIFKLGIAIFITITLLDRLFMYGLLLAITAGVVVLVKRYYCHINYLESAFAVRKHFNIGMFKEMLNMQFFSHYWNKQDIGFDL